MNLPHIKNTPLDRGETPDAAMWTHCETEDLAKKKEKEPADLRDPANRNLQKASRMLMSLASVSADLHSDGERTTAKVETPRDERETPRKKRRQPTISDGDLRPYDVLLGKCPKLRKHDGNEWCRDLVASHYRKYYDSDKAQKTELSEDIVELVGTSGGRFLKLLQNDESNKKKVWVEASKLEARNRVSTIFRNITKSIRKTGVKVWDSLILDETIAGTTQHTTDRESQLDSNRRDPLGLDTSFYELNIEEKTASEFSDSQNLTNSDPSIGYD
jgi:hypothetical protein